MIAARTLAVVVAATVAVPLANAIEELDDSDGSGTEEPTQPAVCSVALSLEACTANGCIWDGVRCKAGFDWSTYCPFTVAQGSPCRGVCITEPTSAGCCARIQNFCQMNADVDPACRNLTVQDTLTTASGCSVLANDLGCETFSADRVDLCPLDYCELQQIQGPPPVGSGAGPGSGPPIGSGFPTGLPATTDADSGVNNQQICVTPGADDEPICSTVFEQSECEQHPYCASIEGACYDRFSEIPSLECGFMTTSNSCGIVADRCTWNSGSGTCESLPCSVFSSDYFLCIQQGCNHVQGSSGVDTCAPFDDESTLASETSPIVTVGDSSTSDVTDPVASLDTTVVLPVDTTSGITSELSTVSIVANGTGPTSVVEVDESTTVTNSDVASTTDAPGSSTDSTSAARGSSLVLNFAASLAGLSVVQRELLVEQVRQQVASRAGVPVSDIVDVILGTGGGSGLNATVVFASNIPQSTVTAAETAIETVPITAAGLTSLPQTAAPTSSPAAPPTNSAADGASGDSDDSSSDSMMIIIIVVIVVILLVGLILIVLVKRSKRDKGKGPTEPRSVYNNPVYGSGVTMTEPPTYEVGGADAAASPANEMKPRLTRADSMC